jgi:alpha-tubulin suppressor-like RCC1 family protein
VLLVAGCGRIAFDSTDAGDAAFGDGDGDRGDGGGLPALVAAHVNNTCAIIDGALSCWGQNSSGQLLTGDMTDRDMPIPIGSDRDWIDVMPGQEHICGVRAGGSLYCWGGNVDGQLGTGDFNPRMTPTLVPLARPVISLDAWFHTCAVLDNFELWCWGNNNEGELGQGDLPGAPDSPMPVQLGVGMQWSQVATGQGHTIARAGADVYGTGRNTTDELGLGASAMNQYRVLTPIATGFTMVAAAQSSSCGIRTDDSVACWGANTFGQLGTGDTAPRDLPTMIGSGQRVVDTDTFHGCTLAQTGKINCWGRNVEGQLGTGDRVDQTSPTTSGSFNDWIQLSVGRFHSCAMRSDQSIWCTGQNTIGQVGVPGQSLYMDWTRVF